MFRFWAKVEKTESCWLWTGCKTKGYGQLCIEGKMKYAHRIAYEMAKGPIPEGMSLDHLCRNPSCVNPAHLEPVSHRVNVLRGIGPTAANAAKEQCWRGHEFTAENTYIVPTTGSRSCRACWPLNKANR